MKYVLAVLLFSPLSVWAADVEDLLKSVRQSLKNGEPAEALKTAEKAVSADPKNAIAYFLRGEAHAALRQSTEAIKDFEKTVELDKKAVIAIDRRGGERFKLGMIKESIEDFDTYIKANPKSEAAHWRRGISYYYNGQFVEGAKQFFDGQEEYGADVENAFWHYLCNARKHGLESAKKSLLKLTGVDRRVPMMLVYDLIQGKAKAEDVIAAADKAELKADAKNEAQFYAHLYVGLNYEALGDAKKCAEHMNEAVKHKISHYMWDVAHVHVKLMKKK